MAVNVLSAVSSAVAALRVRLADPTQRGAFRFVGHGAAKVYVDHDNAEQVAAVWACMDVIASALSSSDWNVYAGVRGASNKQDLPDDSLQYILNTRMNAEMTAQAGKRALALAAVGYGNGYAEIERDMAGRIVALWPIAPNRVEPRRDAESGQLFFRVKQEFAGGWVDMEPDELFVIRGASLVGFAGDDAIRRAVQTISTAVALDQYSAGFFGNGAQLGTVFTYKGKLDDTHYQRVKAQIEERHTGVKNAFRSGVFEGNGEWNIHSMGVDAEKSQLVNVKYVSIEEICRWFRVPPHKIAHLLRATNNNIEHQGLEFSRDTLRPWVKEIEQEADYKLIAYRGPRKFVEIDVDWAEQGDYKSRAEAFSTLIGCGVFSPNVVLQKLGENTIGEKGDIRFVNGAAIPLERIGDAYVQAQAKPGLAAPRYGEDEDEDESETVQAWLTTVYSRIERRVRNRARSVSIEKARQDTREYAEAAPNELGFSLGERLPVAKAWALLVLEGADPATAAQAVMKGDQ